MVIDPRSSEQHPAALSRIFDNEFHTFLLAGTRVFGNGSVSDNKKWYFKGPNTPEVTKFLKENQFQVGMTPYYQSPISMSTHAFSPYSDSAPTFPLPDINQLPSTNWVHPDDLEFAGMLVKRALYHDQDVVIVIDLIDNFDDYVEGFTAILADREKHNPKTFSSQEKIDAAVNIATSVMSRLKHTPAVVTDITKSVKCGTEANCR